MAKPVLGDNPFSRPGKSAPVPPSTAAETRPAPARPAKGRGRRAEAAGRAERADDAERVKQADVAGPATERVTEPVAASPAPEAVEPTLQAEPRRASRRPRSGEPAAATPTEDVVLGELEPDAGSALAHAGPGPLQRLGQVFRGVRALVTTVSDALHDRRAQRARSRARELEAIDEFGLDPRYFERHAPLFEFLYRHYFRVESQGLEHLPRSGPALLVANHSGAFPIDSAMLLFSVRAEHPVRRDVRPLLEDVIFHLPYLGVFLNRIGGVRACPENAERLLERGQLVGVFPEGIKGISKLYSERYHLQRFGRGGFVKLALRAGVPIIPVAIVGAEETHPMLFRLDGLARSVGLPYLPVTPLFPLLGPLGLLPLPSKWTIRFCPPVELGPHGPAQAEDGLVVGDLTEKVRQVIQDAVSEIVGRRQSVFLG
jgi:1-acyl-sn-glycerol-3-phosphate acyltransferase